MKCIDCKDCGIVSIMRETLALGSSPHGENPVQVGTDGYDQRARAECHAFINQLRRVFLIAHSHPLPDDVRLRITSNPHDFGTYYEVAATFDDSNAVAIEAAYWLDSNVSELWDDEAKQELQPRH